MTNAIPAGVPETYCKIPPAQSLDDPNTQIGPLYNSETPPINIIELEKGKLAGDFCYRMKSGWLTETFPWPAFQPNRTLKEKIRRLVFGRRYKINEPIIIAIHSYHPNYYHWVCDILPRILVAKECNLRGKFALPQPLTVFQEKTLDALGVSERIYLRNEDRVRVRNGYAISRVAHFGFQHPLLQRKVASKILEYFEIDVSPPEKMVFIGRATTSMRRILNWHDAKPVIQDAGFIPIEMEKLDFREQLQIAASSKAMIGPHGAGLTNAAFMQPGLLAEIRSANQPPNDCFRALASAMGHKFMVSSNHPTRQGDNNGNITLDLDLLERQLHSIRRNIEAAGAG